MLNENDKLTMASEGQAEISSIGLSGKIVL